MESWSQVEVWHHVTRSVCKKHPGEAISDISANFSSRIQHFTDAGTMKPPLRPAGVVWIHHETTRQGVCTVHSSQKSETV